MNHEAVDGRLTLNEQRSEEGRLERMGQRRLGLGRRGAERCGCSLRRCWRLKFQDLEKGVPFLEAPTLHH